jgi:hypothetical protein
MLAEGGSVEFCIDEPEIMRVRANGVGLRVFSRMGMMDTVCARADGSMELLIGGAGGKLLFFPIEGSVRFNQWWRMFDWASDDVTADFHPGEDGKLEIAIHEYIAGGQPLERYRPFDDCVGEAGDDYLRWRGLYGGPTGDEALFDAAAYLTWIGRLKPRKCSTTSKLRGNMIYGSRRGSDLVSVFEQTFHALAFDGADAKLELLKNTLRLADVNGALPAYTTDAQSQFGYSTAPAYVVALGETDGTELVAALEKNAEWWLRWRDRDGVGVPAYAYPKEAGIDCGAGVGVGDAGPTPDLLSYLFLLFSALAEATGDPKWAKAGDGVLKTLLGELDGRGGFTVSGASARGTEFASGLLSHIPLILGDSLPSEVTERLARQIDEGDFWKSEKDLPAVALLVYGLLASHRRETAERVCEWYISHVQSNGFVNNVGDEFASTWAASAYLYIVSALGRGGNA